MNEVSKEEGPRMEIVKSRKGRRPVWMTPFGEEPWGDMWFDRPLMTWPRWQGEEFNPSMNIAEKEGKYIVSAELPGVKKDDISVSIKGNILTIKGKKEQEKEEKGTDYYIKESSYGSFSRSFDLPEDVEEDKIEATLKDGVLKLVMPHKAKKKAGKIEIKE